MLIVGRAFAGLGGSGLFNGSYTIIASILPAAKQPSTVAQYPHIKRDSAANQDAFKHSVSWHLNGAFLLWPVSRPIDWRCSDRVRNMEMV